MALSGRILESSYLSDRSNGTPLTFEVTLEASVIEAVPEAPEPLHTEEDAAKRSSEDATAQRPALGADEK